MTYYDDQFFERPITLKKLLHLMEIGDFWIEKSLNGFYYMVSRHSGAIFAVNQDLARQAVKDPRVRSEVWREGWGHELSTSERVRFIMD